MGTKLPGVSGLSTQDRKVLDRIAMLRRSAIRICQDGFWSDFMRGLFVGDLEGCISFAKSRRIIALGERVAQRLCNYKFVRKGG